MLTIKRASVSDSDFKKLVYELDEDLRPLRHYYLGNQAEIEAAAKAVANQGKSKSS